MLQMHRILFIISFRWRFVMEKKVLDLLEEVCEDDIVKEDRDVNLFEEDLLDSLTFTQLLVLLEEELGVIISPSEVEKEMISTPNKVIQIVLSKQNQ